MIVEHAVRHLIKSVPEPGTSLIGSQKNCGPDGSVRWTRHLLDARGGGVSKVSSNLRFCAHILEYSVGGGGGTPKVPPKGDPRCRRFDYHKAKIR